MSVYINIGKCRLYSCDIDFNKAYIQLYGLTNNEIDELFKGYDNPNSKEAEDIRKRFLVIKERNIKKLERKQEEEWKLLKKYYPDFAKTLEENENEVLEKKSKATEEYFRIIHPEYNELPESEKAKLEYDKSLLFENVDELDSFLTKTFQETSKKELIEYFLGQKKTDKFFEIMYPEYAFITPAMSFKLLFERDFIEEHLEEIDSYYKKCKEQNSRTQLKDENDREIIATAINSIKKEIADKENKSRLEQARDRKRQAEQRKNQAYELERQAEQALEQKKGKTQDEH